MQLDLIDAVEASQARDAALKQVADNAPTFMSRGLEAIRKLPRGKYIGEEIRAELIAKQIEPHHQNAWGSLIRSALKSNLIRPTGNYRKMRSAKSHARESREYVICAGTT